MDEKTSAMYENIIRGSEGRVEMLNGLYGQIDEDIRLNRSRQGQLEYFI